MVIIRISDREDWCKANWVFRQLAADVAKAFPNDSDLNLALEKAEAFGILRLNDGDRELCSRVARALTQVADDTVHGRIGGWRAARPDDLDGQQMYFDALTELLRFFSENDEAVV